MGDNIKDKSAAKEKGAAGRKRKPIIVSAVILCAAVIAVAIFLLLKPDKGDTTETTKKPGGTTDKTEVVELPAQATAKDQKTLRELLETEGDCRVTVTDDVTIDSKTVYVVGDKTIEGDGRITMSVSSKVYSDILTVEDGASLTLDGVTIDGNGVANCVRVENGGKLKVESGGLLYGVLNDIDNFGDVVITGGNIADSLSIGILIHEDATLDISGGAVQGCVDSGIHNLAGGKVKVSGDALLQENICFSIYNKGDCDITGGIFKNSPWTLICNQGNMDINPKTPMIWENIDSYALTDMSKDAVLNMSNVTIKHSGKEEKNKIYIQDHATANITDVNIQGGLYSGIMANTGAYVTLDNVTISGVEKDGIQVCGADTVLKGRDVVIENTGRNGINTYDKGTADFTDLTVTNVKQRGLSIDGEGTSFTARDVVIDGVGDAGIRVYKKAVATVDGATVSGDIKGTGVAVYDSGTLLGNDLTVKAAGAYALNAYTGGIVGTEEEPFKDITVSGAKQGGISADGGARLYLTGLVSVSDSENHSNKDAVRLWASGTHLTMTSGEMKIQDASNRGFQIYEGASATLDKLTVDTTRGQTACVNINGSNKSGTTFTANTVIVKNAGTQGVNVYSGAKAEIRKALTVTNVKQSGISIDGEGSEITVKNALIENTGDSGIRVYKKAVATVDGATVSGDIKGTGVAVYDSGTLLGNDLTVKASGAYALNAYTGGSVGKEEEPFKDITVSGAKQGGISADGGARLYLTGLVSVSDSENHSDKDAVRLWASGTHLTMTSGEMKIQDASNRGFQIYEGASATLDKLTVDTTRGQTACVNINGSNKSGTTFTANTVIVKNAGTQGVNVYSGAKAEIRKALTVTNVKQSGISIDGEGSEITVKNALIENTGDSGIRVYKKAVATVDGVTVSGDIKGTGVAVYDSGTLLGNDLTVKASGAYALNAYTGGSVGTEDKPFKDITVSGAKQGGISADGGARITVAGSVFVSEEGSVNSYGIRAWGDGTVVSIKCDRLSAAALEKQSIFSQVKTLFKSLISGDVKAQGEENTSYIKGASSGGVIVHSGAELELENIDVTDSGGFAVTASGVNERDKKKPASGKTSTLKLTGVRVLKADKDRSAVGRGISITEGVAATLKDVTVKDVAKKNPATDGDTIYAETAINVGGVGIYVSAALELSGRAAVDTSVTVEADDGGNGLLLEGCAGRSFLVYKGAGITSAKNVTIRKSGDYGIQVSEGSFADITNLQVEDTNNATGVQAFKANSVINIHGGSVKGAVRYAIDAAQGGTINLYDDITIDKAYTGDVPGERDVGIWSETGSTVNVYGNVTIKNATLPIKRGGTITGEENITIEP